MGEDKDIGNFSDNFMRWLANQKKDLCTKAYHAAPNEFVGWKIEWNWEVSAVGIFSLGTSLLNCHLV